MLSFSEILDAADQLPDEDQAVLLGVLRRRLAEKNRERLEQEIRDGNREFENGNRGRVG